MVNFGGCYFDNHRHMVADFCPFTIFSDLDLLNSIGPRVWQKYIINVVATILVVVKIMRRSFLFALAFGEKVMVRAEKPIFNSKQES